MAKKTATKKTTKRTTKRKVVKKIPRADTGKSASLPVEPPIALGAVLGQDRAVSQLSAAMASGRLHHAWIFHGPEGVGKYTAALAWGALLLDPTTAPGLTGGYACDPESQTQQLLAAGTHPDLHVVRKELARFSSESKVRDSKLATIPKAVVEQHLIEPAAIAPVMRTGSMAGKVFIVDEAELLDRSATNAPTQNAILKTLEEPAPGTVIILVTSSEDRLLPTIRSRCQRVAFGPLDDVPMHAWENARSDEIPHDERLWLLGACQGSPGRFVALREGRAYDWHLAVDPMLADAERGVHPLALGATMTKLVDDWAGAWVKQGDKAGENRSKDAANRVGVKRMLSLVADRARTGLADPNRSGASLNTIEMVGRAQQELNTNVQMRMVFDHLAAGLSSKH